MLKSVYILTILETTHYYFFCQETYIEFLLVSYLILATISLTVQRMSYVTLPAYIIQWVYTELSVEHLYMLGLVII